MSAHFVSLKGDRDANEDGHNIILGMDPQNEDPTLAKINYYGIYDGHGGDFVSKFLSNNLPQFFVSSEVKYPLDVKYVNKVYDEVQKTLFTKHTKDVNECGSTCLVVCHFKDENGTDYLNIMNTGDCRAVLCRNNLGRPLTIDHKPDWIDERCRITQLGGQVKKIRGTYRIDDLSVSRAFGDKMSSKYVTHRPDVFKYQLKPNVKDKFVIIACDGLWDVVSAQDAVNLVLKTCYESNTKRINHDKNIAKILAETAIRLKCEDNVTCIVVFFD